jgi:predicted dehydrogenase
VTERSALRFGIVGAGIRGSLFARAVGQQTGADVVAVCDPSPNAREKVAAEHGLHGYASHEEMFAAEELDAVVVATPDPTHAGPALAAAEAGLHLMVEKPLATSVADARAITDAVERAGVKCMLGFENRWNPRLISAQAAVAAGAVGDVLTQVAHLHDTTFVPEEMLRWAADSSPAWFLMPHSLDLVLWLGGGTVDSVTAVGVRRELVGRGVDTWDSIDALLTFTDGSTATLHSSWVLPRSFPSVFDLRLEVTGTTSALRIDGADQGTTLIGPEGYRYAQHGLWESGGNLHGYPVDMAGDLVRWLHGADLDVPTVREGLLVTEIIDAVHRSLTTGERVTFDPSAPSSTSPYPT